MMTTIIRRVWMPQVRIIRLMQPNHPSAMTLSSLASFGSTPKTKRRDQYYLSGVVLESTSKCTKVITCPRTNTTCLRFCQRIFTYSSVRWLTCISLLWCWWSCTGRLIQVVSRSSPFHSYSSSACRCSKMDSRTSRGTFLTGKKTWRRPRWALQKQRKELSKKDSKS